MGAKCCIPVRDDVPMILRKEYRGGTNELYSRRSNRCSPSWSFRCDNRTHIEDTVDTPTWLSQGHGSLNVSDFRSSENLEIEGISSGGSSLSNTFQLPENSQTNPTDLSIAGSSSREETEIKEEPTTISASDPSSSRVRSQPSSSTSSLKKPCPFTGHRFSPIPTFDSLNELSFRSNDLSNAESHALSSSSEDWSIRSFSELVVSPQPSPIFVPSDKQTCILCSKALKERGPMGYETVPAVAVLSCGHVFHAECLENVTPESSKFDPNCPTCYKSKGKALVKACSSSSSASKSRYRISKRAVADVNADGNFGLNREKCGSLVLKDMKLKSSFGRSLKRHLFLGSRSLKLSPEMDSSSKKKGLWARYR